MRSIDDILSHLRRENITLWLDGGRLRYRAPKGSIASDLRDELHERKTELISFFATEETLPALSEDLDNRHEPFPLTDIQQAYWVGRSRPPSSHRVIFSRRRCAKISSIDLIDSLPSQVSLTSTKQSSWRPVPRKEPMNRFSPTTFVK